MNSKYIFITGGIISPRDMVNVTSSVACLLKARGYRVAMLELAPYFNHDSSTLNTEEYGECYIGADGTELPFTLGIYERFTGEPATHENCITMGNILLSVCNKERRGDYKGEKVLLTPHVTDEIKRRITRIGESGNYDFVIMELGGCVSDFASYPFMEAMRQIRNEKAQDSYGLHLADSTNTFSATEPLRRLIALGIRPDALLLFTDKNRHNAECLIKLAEISGIEADKIVKLPNDTPNYAIPLHLLQTGVDSSILSALGFDVNQEPDMTQWFELADKASEAADSEAINIAILGVNSLVNAANESLRESLQFAAIHNNASIILHQLEPQRINSSNAASLLEDFDGIIAADSSDASTEESNIAALKSGRELNIPTLAIGFGMCCMVKEFARNVMKIDADDVITTALTRFDAEGCTLQSGSRTAKIYGNAKIVTERRGNTFEVNRDYSQRLEHSGMKPGGTNPRTQTPEIVEIPDLRWYIATIFNPEYSSTMLAPNPLIADFVSHAINYHNLKNQNG